MKKVFSWIKKKHRGIISSLSYSLFTFAFFGFLEMNLSDKIQAWAIVTLVLVTGFYAIKTKEISEQAKKQAQASSRQASSTSLQAEKTALQAHLTSKLIEEQKLARDLEFSERRLHSLYNPLIFHLDEALKNFGEKKLSDIYDKYLSNTHKDIYYVYAYMLSNETFEVVGRFLTDVFVKGIDENNDQSQEDDRKKIGKDLYDIRKKLHEERLVIECHLNSNYSHPEARAKDGNIQS